MKTPIDVGMICTVSFFPKGQHAGCLHKCWYIENKTPDAACSKAGAVLPNADEQIMYNRTSLASSSSEQTTTDRHTQTAALRQRCPCARRTRRHCRRARSDTPALCWRLVVGLRMLCSWTRQYAVGLSSQYPYIACMRARSICV